MRDRVEGNRHAHQVLEATHLAHLAIVVLLASLGCLIVLPQGPAAGEFELVTHWLLDLVLGIGLLLCRVCCCTLHCYFFLIYLYSFFLIKI